MKITLCLSDAALDALMKLDSAAGHSRECVQERFFSQMEKHVPKTIEEAKEEGSDLWLELKEASPVRLIGIYDFQKPRKNSIYFMTAQEAIEDVKELPILAEALEGLLMLQPDYSKPGQA